MQPQEIAKAFAAYYSDLYKAQELEKQKGKKLKTF